MRDGRFLKEGNEEGRPAAEVRTTTGVRMVRRTGMSVATRAHKNISTNRHAGPTDLSLKGIAEPRAAITNNNFSILNSQSPSTLNPQPSTLQGFTIVELAGVLAILAIIAAVLYPQVIRRIDIAAKERERTDLLAISNALVLRIVTTRTITDQSGWASEAATWAQLPLSKTTTTPRRNLRAFLLDGGGWLTNAPYTQANWGAAQPTNGRIMIVSSMAGALPVSTSKLSKDEFDGIWRTPLDGIPTNSTFAAWKRGEDLLIQRISLDPLFHHLVLVNRDPSTTPSFSIDALAPAALTMPQTNFFLNGTEVTLCDANGTPQRRLLLTRDESFAFDGLVWRPEFYGSESQRNLSQDFAAFAAEFMEAGAPATALQGASPQGVVVGMFNFTLIYSLWANKCFPVYNATSEGQVPEYLLMLDVGGDGNSSVLKELAGPNGLLK